MTEQTTPLPLKSPVLEATLFATALTSVATFFLFGVIHKFTHHRPLGAATLAVMVAAVFLGALALSARLRVGTNVARGALGLALVAFGALAVVG